MRLIGYAERALEMMIERTSSRVAFGAPILKQGTIRSEIAESRMEIEQARYDIIYITEHKVQPYRSQYNMFIITLFFKYCKNI